MSKRTTRTHVFLSTGFHTLRCIRPHGHKEDSHIAPFDSLETYKSVEWFLQSGKTAWVKHREPITVPIASPRCDSTVHGVPEYPTRTPHHEAAGLVALLGWDWWEGVDALEEEDDEVLHAYLDILRVERPDDDERTRSLSRIGTQSALRVLHARALESGRLSDDGCPIERVDTQ